MGDNKFAPREISRVNPRIELMQVPSPPSILSFTSTSPERTCAPKGTIGWVMIRFPPER